MKMWIGFNWFHGSEPSNSVKRREFID